MNDLSGFLNQNAIQVENIKYAASKRFLGEDGKPLEWEIKAITNQQNEELKRECTVRKPVAGKKGVFIPVTDVNKHAVKTAVLCTVYPDLNNKELQDSYGVMGAEDLLLAMLIPGEYTNYIEKINEINGFDIGFEDLEEEAKNS
jgi:hypothetical protein